MGLFTRGPTSPVVRLMAAAGLPTAGGEIPLDALVMQVVRRDNGRLAAVLAVVEHLLAGGEQPSGAALDFVEGLQNAASHGIPEFVTAADVLPLCGSRTAAAWQTVERFWSAVAAWCDENGMALKSSESLREIANPRLRLGILPAHRSLPDGRQVGLADVVRYEMRVGVPMGGPGPHTQA